MNSVIANELLRYDPETGVLYWRVSVRSGARTGQRAGCPGNRGYRQVKICGQLYMAHRLIWLIVYGEFPPNEIDHINGVRDDNRLVNLRAVTRSENRMNQRIGVRNTSGYIGVSWCKQSSKWVVQISVNKQQINLGRFSDMHDAARVRKSAEIKYGYHPNHGRA